MNEKPTHLDLFSGIGGFSLAFEAEGFQTIGFAEIDPYASAVLKKHWPHVANYGDVRNVPAVGCDVLTGGFPCQPFSFAGKRKGKDDDRHLWPAMRDVIERCKPAWIVGENVPGIIGMELERVLTDLESLSFVTQTLVVPACAVDAKHRRDRVWIVAYNDRFRSSASGANECETGASKASCGNGPAVANDVREQKDGNDPEGLQHFAAGGGETVSDADKPGLEGRNRRSMQKRGSKWTTWASSPFTANSPSNGRNKRNTDTTGSDQGTRTKEERSKPADYSRWLPEPGLGRVANGIPNRTHRLRCLGNSIVPQVAQVFARAIRQLI